MVSLRIEPECCGPLSIGTVRVVQLVRHCFELSLDEAARVVDTCVFDGRIAHLRAPSAAAAERFVTAVAALPPVPRITASVSSA